MADEVFFRGYNQEKIQDLNRTLVLNMIRRSSVCTRVWLAKESGLKQATITNMINDFIRWGIVKETGFLTGDKGRRSIGISMDKDTYGILAVRLARRSYSIGVFDLRGDPVKVVQRAVPKDQNPEVTISKILSDTEKLKGEISGREYLAIGVALPGPYSRKSGRIEIMTGTKGWNEIPIGERFEERFHLPVFVEQDANAGALAQYWKYEEDHPGRMLVYLAVGPGIGAGIINRGEILRGVIGVAGEVGHMSINYNGPRCACGNRGCLENYCSSRAFTERVNEIKEAELTFEEAAVLLREDDPEVKAVFLDICDMLSVAIANIINCFNPSIIILGDEMSHIVPELMVPYIRERVETLVLPALYEDTVISASLLPVDSFVHGAAIVALSEIFSNPEKYFEKTSKTVDKG